MLTDWWQVPRGGEVYNPIQGQFTPFNRRQGVLLSSPPPPQGIAGVPYDSIYLAIGIEYSTYVLKNILTSKKWFWDAYFFQMNDNFTPGIAATAVFIVETLYKTYLLYTNSGGRSIHGFVHCTDTLQCTHYTTCIDSKKVQPLLHIVLQCKKTKKNNSILYTMYSVRHSSLFTIFSVYIENIHNNN